MAVKKPTILAISSPGGHWVQLTYLCSGFKDHYKIVYAMSIKKFKPQETRKFYSIVDFSSDDKWRLIPCTFQVAYILLKERPTAILSTGAAPGAIAIVIGKLLGIRTIWIESLANVKKISRSGQLVRNWADIFLTQWEHLSDDRAILYRGSIL